MDRLIPRYLDYLIAISAESILWLVEVAIQTVIGIAALNG